MQKQRRLIVVAMVVIVLLLIVHRCIRKHSYADIEKKEMLENKIVLLTKQLRTAKEQNMNMHKVIDNLKLIPDCEVIHIAAVCIGHTATRNLVILIKSILLHRKHQLHFHFITDNTVRHILEYMFKTWELPSVKNTFYSTEKFKNETVLDITNMDVENYYKLNIPKILPRNIKKVIIFDTDVIVNKNIAEFWKLFDYFKDKQAIGAFEIQKTGYLETLKTDMKDLPVLTCSIPTDRKETKIGYIIRKTGNGINTGMLLYNLKSLRKMNFVKKAKTIEEKLVLLTKLSFENIFNIVLARNTGILQLLPQTWNLQMRGQLTVDICNTSMISELKIVHGYANNNYSLGSRCMVVFKKLRNLVSEISGNLLKQESTVCKQSQSSKEQYSFLVNKSDDCIDFRIQRTNSFRTHLYFIEYYYTPKTYDVTFVTQMSMDKLFMLLQLCRQWEGPISVALHLTELETNEFLKFTEEPTFKNRKNIGYHIVYKEGTNGLYPYNHLRNVAFENVNTPYVFLCDADLSPSYGMYEQLRKDIADLMDSKSKKYFNCKQKKDSSISVEKKIQTTSIIIRNTSPIKPEALVVPAFEQHTFKLIFPENKQQLLKQLDMKQIVPFHVDIFPTGHGPTDYAKWIQATIPYEINYDRFYEPYIVLPKSAPRYDTRFVGWGWDKLSHTVELAADGYEFVVLPNVFIVHHSHAVTYHRTLHFSDEKYGRCVQKLKQEFLNEIATKYGQRGRALKNFINIKK